MDAPTFFGLRRTDEPTSWQMPVVPNLISGTGALFGGCGLGAAIEVMEQVDRPARASGRPRNSSRSRARRRRSARGRRGGARPPDQPGPRDGVRRTTARSSLSSARSATGRNPLAGQWATRARRTAARRLSAPAADEPAPGHDHGPLRVEARRRAPVLGAHRDGGSRQRVALGARSRSRRRVGGRARDHRRLRAVRHRPGARRSARAATASTTRCASRTASRPSGCSPTCGCTRSPTASATASCTSGPRTATLLGTASQSTIVRAHGPVRCDDAL